MQLIFKAIASKKVENHQHEQIEKIVLSSDDIKNGKNGFRFVEEHEFLYKNEMYDIVKTEKSGNITIFYCINDKNEGILGILFNKMVNENTNDTKNGTNSKSQQKNIIQEALEPEFFLCDIIFSKTNAPVFEIQHLITTESKIFTPPPEL